MGNFILQPEENFITYTATANHADAVKVVSNVAINERPKRHARSANLTQWEIKLNMGSTGQVVQGLFINRVNFESMTIQGNDTDAWGAPSFSQSVTVYEDERVKRYKGLFLLTGFAYKYVRLVVPVQDTTDTEAFYQIGNVIPLADATEFAKNPAWPYSWWPDRPTLRVQKKSGNVGKRYLNLDKAFNFKFGFEGGDADLAPLMAKDSYGDGELMIFSENGWDGGGTQYAYLVRRDGSIKPSYDVVDHFTTDVVKFTEVT